MTSKLLELYASASQGVVPKALQFLESRSSKKMACLETVHLVTGLKE